MDALDGSPLATFWQRLLGYGIDLNLAVIVWAPLEIAWRHYLLHEEHIELKWDFHEPGNIIIAFLFFVLAN